MYEIRVLRRAVKDLGNVPRPYAEKIARQIDQLAENPRPTGVKKLHGRRDYRLRVGPYRILYEIDDDTEIVTIFRIKHRREAYR